MVLDKKERLKSRRKNLSELAKTFDYAMLVTERSDGGRAPNARPMALIEVDDDSTLRFMTDIRSQKVDEILADEHVTVTMQDGARAVSMGGSARVLVNQSLIDDLWSERFDVWMPRGKNGAAIIEFTPRVGEYWDASAGTLFELLVEGAAALFTDERVEWRERTHGLVQMEASQ